MSAVGTRRSGADSGGRRCGGCGTVLAADNTARLCGPCSRDQRDQLRTPPAQLRDDFFDTDEFRAACESEDFGKLTKAYRNHPYIIKKYGKPISQTLLARWLDISQGLVSKLETDKQEGYIPTLRIYAKKLHLPQRILWFKLDPGQEWIIVPRGSEEPKYSLPRTSFAQYDTIDMVDATVPQITLPDNSEMVTDYLLSDSLFSEDTRRGPNIALASNIRDTVADLMAMDLKRGGGHTRRMLMHYYQDEAAPLLSWRYSDTNLRNDVFSAVAETLQLLGWSAYDSGSHGAARRYFSQAVRLSREAGDVMMTGRILSNMSHQANFLGNFDEALKFSRHAQEVAGNRASNTVMSMFVAMEARALASLGDEHGTARALHRAELLHDSRDPGRDPTWISYFNSQELSSEAAHCFRDLGHAHKCREFAELSMDPVHTPQRTLSFMRMVAASGSLAGGDAERAISLAAEAIQLGVSVKSARYVKYLIDFRDALAAQSGALGIEVSEMLHSQYPNLIPPSY